MAWWIGGSTRKGRTPPPRSSRDPTRSSPLCTAPTSLPMAMANGAGRIPRGTSAAHQAAASVRSAPPRTYRPRHPSPFRSLIGDGDREPHEGTQAGVGRLDRCGQVHGAGDVAIAGQAADE